MAPETETALFKSLSDPTRRALYERLAADGPLTVARLTEGAGISQPAVSKHLGVLKRAGLVDGSVEGRTTRYAATPGALRPLAAWTARMSGVWDDALDDLGDLLRRMDR